MLDQPQNSLLTLLQEEEQIFSGSRERLHLPVAKQRKAKEFCKGERLEAFGGAGGRQKAGARYLLACHGAEKQVGTALAPANARNPNKKWLQLQ